MLVELPSYYAHYYQPGAIKWFEFNLDFFNGASITFFSFTCQASIIPIYSELVKPDERRMMKVIGRSLVVDCLFYCAIALAGYFSTFDHTPDCVIARPLLQEPDYAIAIASVAVILVVLVSSPANYFPFKNTVNYMITGKTEMTLNL